MNDRYRTAVALGALAVLVALFGVGEASLCVGHRTHCSPVGTAGRELLFGALVAVALVALVVRKRTL